MFFLAACHICGETIRVPDEYNQVDRAKLWASNWEDGHIAEKHPQGTANLIYVEVDNGTAKEKGSEAKA